MRQLAWTNPNVSALGLFVRLIAMIVVIESVIMWLLPEAPFNDFSRIFIDAGLLALFCAPLIWRLIVQPLQRAAREGEGKFRALVEQSLIGISIIAEGRFLYVNPKHEEIFGYTTAEMLSMHPQELAVPEDRPTIAENMRKRLTGEIDQISYFFRGLRKDGSVIDVLVHGKRTLLDDRPVIVGVLMDVTAQKAAEKALKSEHDFISAVLETTGALVVVLDRGGRIVRFNHQCKKTTGYRSAEVVGRPVWDKLLAPEEVPAVKAVFEHLVAGNFPREYENWWVARNGERRMISWSNTVLTDEADEVKFVIATGIDVTERRRAEAALRESEERYRILFNSGYDAIMVHPVLPDGQPGQFIEVNDLACRRLGYTREEMLRLSPAQIDDPASVIDIPRISRLIEIEGHALFERVHVTKDGRQIPVEINTHVIELNGRPVALSIVRDTTERKLAEAALRESETKLREITSELGDGIYVLDRDGLLTFMNKAAEHMLGWSEADLLGKKVHDIFHFQKPDGTRVPACECPVYQAIQSGETYRILEDYFTRRDGSMFPVSFVASPLHRAGKITGSVAAFQDITERKEAEDRIQYMAHHDMLTGLPNRVLLADRLVAALAQAKRYNRLLAVMFLDLDHFKRINDTLGHDVGDLLLQGIAARLIQCVRQADTVARMGGDEFVILLSETTGAGDAEIVARKVIESINQPLTIGGHALHISTSVGIALYPGDGEDAQTLMKNADTAMYRTKEGGRNGYRFHGRE